MHEPYRFESGAVGSAVSPDLRQVPRQKHANEAVAEVRRAEFFRKGGATGLDQGKALAVVDPLVHLNTNKKRQLNELFALNRRVMKAYLLKESLDRLWNYTYEGAMLRYLQSWIDQLRWQRLKAYGEASADVLNHLEGLLNYCRIKYDGRSGSRQWKHQRPCYAVVGLPRSRLSAAEGPALGSHQDPIRRFPESRLECTFLQIVVQSLKILGPYRKCVAPCSRVGPSVSRRGTCDREIWRSRWRLRRTRRAISI